MGGGRRGGERPDRLPGTAVVAPPPVLPGMDEIELAVADVWATGLSPDSFPTQFIRDRLDGLGAKRAPSWWRWRAAPAC